MLFFLIYFLFIYFWLCWVFVSVRGLSLVAVSGDHSSSRCTGLSLSQPLLLWSTGSRRAGSVVVAHGPSCPAACGILPDQGSNPCPLHWQADSQPLRHQGSPQVMSYGEYLPIFLWLHSIWTPFMYGGVVYCVYLGGRKCPASHYRAQEEPNILTSCSQQLGYRHMT